MQLGNTYSSICSWGTRIVWGPWVRRHSDFFLLVLRISKYVFIYYVYCYEKIIRIFLFPIRLGMVISISCTFFELLKFTVHIVIVANLHQTENWPSCNEPFFLSWETTKREKTLDKLRFYWANMRKKEQSRSHSSWKQSVSWRNAFTSKSKKQIRYPVLQHTGSNSSEKRHITTLSLLDNAPNCT